MIKLWIYTKDHCAWFDVDSIHEYDRFQFERRNQGVCIFYKQNKKVLKCNESCILDHTTFFLDEKQSTQCHFPIETSIQVGRSGLCNIQLFKSGVSRFHFKIEKDVLTDLDSLNGTYVNTKRVHSYKLNMQDEIVIANIRMIYFKKYLLVDMVDNPFENKDLKREEPMFYPSNLNVQLPTIQKWDIQMPQIHRVVCKQSLFSAIGPSCMIASSGFISSILIGYLQKQSVETLFMSMISSLTMAVTFMIYGLYNRNYQYKLSVKENEVNDLKNRIADAEKDVADAQNAYNQAKADYDSTLTPLELAQKNLADFEKAHADQLARLNQGIQGYYDSIGATAATDIIKNPRGKLNGHTNIGAANDATSLDNVINSISYLKEFNKIRVSEGLSELKVSMVLMAIAQANANWQRDTAEIGNVAHSGVYNTGENAAWGYGDAESKASPFTVWYTLEKSWYENGITDSHKIGHYKNIVNARYDYTGYAHIEEGAYGSTDIQEFDQYWGDNVYGNEATGSENDRIVTLEEFETSLNNYASELKDVSNQRKSLEEAVKKAQTSGTEKDDTALKSALALLNNRKDVLKTLNEQMTKASGEKAQADTAKAKAEANFQKAEQAVKEAEANAEAKATAKVTAETNLSKAKAEVSAKKMAKVEAENNLAQANQDVAHISETIDALTHTINNWNTEKAKAEKALETAQTHLKDAKANAEAKKQGLETAKSDLAKAENKKADAQTEAEHAKADSDKANKALEEATTVFNKASEKANFYKDISDKTNATDKDVEKITGRISQLRKAKDTADSEITTLNQTVSTKKTKANLLNSQAEPFKRQRAVLANVVAVGSRADLSEITDTDMLALFEDLGQKVDTLSVAKKTLENVQLDYQTKQSAYLKAHDDLNKAVDEYNLAMSALNTYLREQEAEAKKEAAKKAENTDTTKADSKADSKAGKVDTGVESFATGYVASAGIALAGLAATKHRRK